MEALKDESKPEEVAEVVSGVEAEPLDVIKEHDAGDEEDLREVEGLDTLPLVPLELDAWRRN